MLQAPSSKLPQVGTTIFTIMSGLASEKGAINLGQGFPDFPMDARLQDAVSRAMRNGHNQYAPMPGWLPLREAIAEKIDFLYGTSVDPGTEVTITPGGTYAIYTAFTSFLRPGDEVIVFEPCYDSYIPNIEINGATAVRIPLRVPGFGIDWPAFDRALTPRTRAIIINSPHNPTGSVLSHADMVGLSNRLVGTDILIVSDEVYEHLVFDGLQHASVLRYPELRARSFACFSFGKVYNCTGWKMGYCVAPDILTREFRKVHQFNGFSVNSPMQVGLTDFLSDRTAYLNLGPDMQSRRDLFISLMQDTPFTLQPSQGSYFILATYERFSEEPDRELAIRLTRDIGVATIPVSAFYADGTDHHLLRFCFCKQEATLREACRRLRLL
jgi:methionine aminotransferase